MFKRFAEIVLILKWPLFLTLLLITVVTGVSMLRLRIDPSMEALFIKNSPEYRFYREYREKYGSDQIIAVAMATSDLFRLDNLRQLDELTQEIGRFPQVDRVLTLANALDIKHKFMGVKMVRALEGLFEGERNVEEVKNEVLANELYVGNLVSANGKIATILIFLKTEGKEAAASGVFIHRLRRYLASQEQADLKFYVAGAPVEQYDFIGLIRRDQFTFVPMITFLLVVTTFLVYRSLACMILSMSIVFMTVIWTMGSIALLGGEMNLMTSLLAPVIMIVAVADSVHLMNLFFEIRPHHPSLRKSVVLVITQLGAPCLLTHLTTALGFLSLAVSPIPAIASFGKFAALGNVYSYVVDMLLTPILLPILPYRRVEQSFSSEHFFNRLLVGFLEQLEFRWKWVILFLTGAMLVASFVGIRRLNVDTNIVKQLKPDLPLAIATRFIDNHLTGVYTLGFLLRRKDGGTFQDYETLRKVEALKDYLEAMPEITKVNSITTLLKKINLAREEDPAAYRVPEDAGRLERYFRGIAESKDPEIWKLISRDFKELRLEARMKAVGTREGSEVEENARRYMEKNLGESFDYNQTGNVVLLGRMAKDLVIQQVRSFGTAFASILLVIVLIFRSLRLGLLAAIPNLFPIFAIYGFMGFAGIELSTTTAMLSSIVLGLVVDASIHFLHRFRLEFSHRFHYLQSLHHTFRNVGQALVVSTLILVVGFASSVFASFKPTIHFGVLTSCTIFFSLICTLVILPVCLVLFKPFGPQQLFLQKKTRRTHFRRTVGFHELLDLEKF